MINLIISIVASAAVFAGVGFLFGGGDFKPLYGIVPAIFVFAGVYFYLAKRTFNKVQTVMMLAQQQLQSGGNNKNQQKKLVSTAVETMKQAYPLAKQQFFIKPQIDGQIGSLLFMSKQFKDAEPYLQNAFKRNWTPHAMLAVLYYKSDKIDLMKSTFETAVSSTKKEALLWNLYAFCLWKKKLNSDAVEVLNRAVTHVETDEKTQNNLKALKNKKKMKMRGWNMLWYQFHLDSPPQAKQQMKFRR